MLHATCLAAATTAVDSVTSAWEDELDIRRMRYRLVQHAATLLGYSLVGACLERTSVGVTVCGFRAVTHARPSVRSSLWCQNLTSRLLPLVNSLENVTSLGAL